MIKHTISAILLLTASLACSQPNMNEMKSIAIKEEINRLENYSYEPVYQLRVNTPYAFTVLINGIPVANKYVNYLSSYLVEINSCLPEKGEHTVEIQIFPRFIDEHTQREVLENNADFELFIEKTAWKDGQLEEPVRIYSYKLPEGDYTRQAGFVHKAVFTADVPYKLLDWRNGRTFSPDDTSDVMSKIQGVYETLIRHYEGQNGEAYLNLLGKGLYNLYQSAYFTRAEALDHIRHRIDFINKQKRKFAELEHYELQILGNGKLLSLRRTDGYNKGEGVLRRYYKKGPKEKVQVDDILLYSPDTGSGDYDLEVIWHSNLVKGARP